MKRRYSFWCSYETGLGILGGLTVAFAVVLFIRMVSPVICEKAISRLQSDFTVICNEAVLGYLEKENITYNSMVAVERDKNGKIQAMNTEITEVNKIKSYIMLSIQKKLDKIDTVSVSFPSGGFFGVGGGINIPVKLITVNSLEGELDSFFESAGINQTRLYINMKISAKGKLLLGGREQNMEIKTSVPVAQTVIVGDVPDTYVNIDKTER